MRRPDAIHGAQIFRFIRQKWCALDGWPVWRSCTAAIGQGLKCRFGPRLCENSRFSYTAFTKWRLVMSGYIEGVDREQTTLFPDRLEDWICEDHP
ncbi:hypothetical protein J4E08_10730, partial [Sagittula sp. NFXS13]|uniref:hypothetical protein n=1 Tax=Sagittula sp. NFXS13 TaxID=2819095 RepID=UPI0032DE53FE